MAPLEGRCVLGVLFLVLGLCNGETAVEMMKKAADVSGFSTWITGTTGAGSSLTQQNIRTVIAVNNNGYNLYFSENEAPLTPASYYSAKVFPTIATDGEQRLSMYGGDHEILVKKVGNKEYINGMEIDRKDTSGDYTMVVVKNVYHSYVYGARAYLRAYLETVPPTGNTNNFLKLWDAVATQNNDAELYNLYKQTLKGKITIFIPEKKAFDDLAKKRAGQDKSPLDKLLALPLAEQQKILNAHIVSTRALNHYQMGGEVKNTSSRENACQMTFSDSSTKGMKIVNCGQINAKIISSTIGLNHEDAIYANAVSSFFVVDKVLNYMTQTLFDLISDNGQLSEFKQLVGRGGAKNIMDMLANENGPFTVFAPVDSAFENNFPNVVDDEVLRKLLGIHIVRQKLTREQMMKDIEDSMNEYQTVDAETKMRVTLEDNDLYVTAGGVKAKIISIKASGATNGNMFHLEKVLGHATTIFSKMKSDLSIRVFTAELEKVGLKPILEDTTREFTIFAINDDGMETLQREKEKELRRKIENKDMKTILESYIVKDKKMLFENDNCVNSGKALSGVDVTTDCLPTNSGRRRKVVNIAAKQANFNQIIGLETPEAIVYHIEGAPYIGSSIGAGTHVVASIGIVCLLSVFTLVHRMFNY